MLRIKKPRYCEARCCPISRIAFLSKISTYRDKLDLQLLPTRELHIQFP